MNAKVEQSNLLDAGHEALKRGAWEEARASFKEALQREETPESLDGLGFVAWQLDDGLTLFDAHERAYRLYRERGDSRSAARMATWLAWDYVSFRGDEAIANGWLQRAHRLLDNLDPSLEHVWLAVREGAFALDLNHDAARARELGAEAARLARSLGLPDWEIVALSLEGLALVSQGQIVEGMSRLDEVMAATTAGELNDLIATILACCHFIFGCERAYDFDRAAQWCKRLKELCERWRLQSLFAVCRTHYAGILTWQGFWAEAEAELVAATADLARLRPGQVEEATVRLAELRHRQGRFEEAAALFGQVESQPPAQLGRARLALDEDDPQAAADLIGRFLRRLPLNARMERAAAVEVLALAQIALGDYQQAQASLAELQSLLNITPLGLLEASVHYVGGILAASLGDHDTARCRLEDAVDLFGQNSVPFEMARARIALARSLYALDRHSIAEQEAQAALATLQELGATWEANRAAALLKEWEADNASGSQPDGLDCLTRRELEVLRLVAEGLSNQEIASRLTLSKHTVHRHVSSILGKLGVSSRAAAAACAARHHLL